MTHLSSNFRRSQTSNLEAIDPPAHDGTYTIRQKTRTSRAAGSSRVEGAISDNSRVISNRRRGGTELIGMLLVIGLAVVGSLVCAPLAEATTYAAASCSYADVSAQADASMNRSLVDGDTVTVPACQPGISWTQTLKITKGITLKGAGIDQTVLIDDVWDGMTRQPIISVSCGSVDVTLRDFTIKRGTMSSTTPVTVGTIRLFCDNGVSGRPIIKSVKLHDPNSNSFITAYGGLGGGVFDSTFIGSMGSSNIMVATFLISYRGVGGYGDNSWAQPTSLGSSNFFFIERNTFTTTAGGVGTVLDAYQGSRVVVRNNTVTDQDVCGDHGLDSGGRNRSSRVIECYRNSATYSNKQAVMAIRRGGTGMYFGNTKMGAGTLGMFVQGMNYRDVDGFAPWGACDGGGSWDDNIATVYASGRHTGSTNSNGVLTDNAQNFLTVCAGGNCNGADYRIRNVTRGWSSDICDAGQIGDGCTQDVTTTTLQGRASNYRQERTWNLNDQYQIRKVNYCIDQPGRGAGVYLSGAKPRPTGPPNQAREPIYAWNNTGASLGQIAGRWASAQYGRDMILGFSGSSLPGTCSSYDFFWKTNEGEWDSTNGSTPDGRGYQCNPANTWTLYYTPYTYPHPLSVQATSTPIQPVGR